MKSGTILFALLPALAMAAAPEASWQYLAETSDGALVSVRTGSISRSGKYRKAWFQWINKEEASIPDAAYRTNRSAVTYKSSKELTFFDCTERTYTTVQAIYYSANSDPVATYQVEVEKSLFAEGAPDTIAEAMVVHV